MGKAKNWSLWAIPPEGEPFKALTSDYPDVMWNDDAPFPYLGKIGTKDGVDKYFSLVLRSVSHTVLRSCTFELRRWLNPKWRERETDRIASKEYEKIPDGWKKLAERYPDHFVHVAEFSKDKDPDYIAFTENEDKGMRDIQTRMRAGKYVKKFHPELSNEEVRSYASMVQALNSVQMTDDPELGAIIYMNGPRSCMRHYRHYWHDQWMTYWDEENIKELPDHPVICYFAGDLKLAWIGNPRAASARCLVWPEKKTYSRIYGAVDRMKTALENAGYSDDYTGNSYPFNEARIKHLRLNGDTVIMPYIDGSSQLEYRRDTKQIHMGNALYNKDKTKSLRFAGGGEGGYAHFKDPIHIYCGITGKVIPENANLITTECGRVTTEEIAIRNDFVMTVEGLYTASIRVHYWCEEDKEEAHIPSWRPEVTWVKDYMEIGRTVLVPRSSTIVFDGTKRTRKRNIHKLISWKGHYYSNEANLYKHHPNLVIKDYTNSIDKDTMKICRDLIIEYMGSSDIDCMYPDRYEQYRMYVLHFVDKARRIREKELQNAA